MTYYTDEQKAEEKAKQDAVEAQEVNEIAFTLATELRNKRMELQRKGNDACWDLARRIERAARIIECITSSHEE